MPPNLSPARRAYIASSIRSAVDLAFAHWEAVRGLDLEAGYQELLEATISRGDRGAFSLEMAAFLARLNNGHTFYIDRDGWRPLSGSLGFRAAPLGKDWILTKTWRPGLRAGELLERIDRETPGDWYSDRRRYVPASSEASRSRRFTAHPHLFPRNLVIKVEGRSIAYRRVPGRGDPPQEKTLGRWLRRGTIALVRIPSFADPQHERRALECVRRFHAASAIVLDVRGNGGGSTPGRLLRALMDRPWCGWAHSTPQRWGSVRAHVHLLEMLEKNEGEGLHLMRERLAPLEPLREWDRAKTLFPAESRPPGRGAYRGRLVMLTDGLCGSACEDFLMPFKDTGRATIVGTATDGSTGQPYILDFQEGIRAFVGSTRAYFPDGRPFEGIGIVPDHEVWPTREDLLAGRDPVLDAATELAATDARGAVSPREAIP